MLMVSMKLVLQGLTDLQMYYAKLSNAYETGSGRPVDTDDRFQTNPLGFQS